jgi:hypothetical protein
MATPQAAGAVAQPLELRAEAQRSDTPLQVLIGHERAWSKRGSRVGVCRGRVGAHQSHRPAIDQKAFNAGVLRGTG